MNGSGEFKTSQNYQQLADMDRNVHQLILEHRETGRKVAVNLIRKWNLRLAEEDLQSIVDLALCEAAQRYSAEHGASFPTFLFYYVRGNLIDFIRESMKRKALSDNWKVPVNLDSVDCVNPTQQKPEVQEELMPQVTANPEQMLVRQGDQSAVRACINKLENMEHAIISALYIKNMSQREISKTYGLKRNQVARIKDRALVQLRELLAGTDAAINRKAANSSTTLPAVSNTAGYIRSRRRLRLRMRSPMINTRQAA